MQEGLKATIQIAQRVAELDNSWDDFLPADHHLRSKHLLSFEKAHLDDIDNVYIRVFVKQKLIGLVYLQQFQFQHKHLNFGSSSALLSKAIKFVLPRQLAILICGNLFRINFQGFYFENPEHNPLVFDVIKLFRSENRNCNPSGTIIKDCEEVFTEQHCRFSGYRFFDGDVTMELERRKHWLMFDDYLNDLHKNYRQRARKIIGAFETIERRELGAAEMEAQAHVIEQLYWNVVNKQSIKLGTVNAQYFVELKNTLAEKFEFHALYKNDVMLGFYTFIFYNNEMETHYIGLDYEANKTHQVYFNILFAGVQKMIERQFDKLELGRTAREAKSNLGALPRQVFNYIQVSNPLVKITVNHFLKKFNRAEHTGLIKRNPLR